MGKEEVWEKRRLVASCTPPPGDLATSQARPLTGTLSAGCCSTHGATPARAIVVLKKNIFI